MGDLFFTVGDTQKLYGTRPFRVGKLMRGAKSRDSEELRLEMPPFGTVGFVASSGGAAGSMSAGRIYDRVGTRFYAKVAFVVGDCVICAVVDGDADALEAELSANA